MNWYKELSAIAERELILAVTICNKLYSSLDKAKELLDYKFDDSWGTAEGPAFVLWTEDNIYFPVTYDGSEWIEKLPRDPCPLEYSHIGGQ